jgi:hypothetical protein
MPTTPLLPPSQLRVFEPYPNPVARPLEVLKDFSSRFRTARDEYRDALIAAGHFDRILITVRSNTDTDQWPYLSLSSIPDLRGINPHSTIFGSGRASSLSPNPRFLAAITVPLSDMGNDTSGEIQSPMPGVETGCTEPNGRFPIPSDRMLLVLLRYNSNEKYYELIKPNNRRLFNLAGSLCSVSADQQWFRENWPWKNLAKSLGALLADKGLDVGVPFNHQPDLNDTIIIKAQDSETIHQPYEVLADVLEAIARVNYRREGLFNPVETRPDRPPATNITEEAKVFIRETGVAAIIEQLHALVEEGRNLLGGEIHSLTVGCLGELISRLEKEAKSASRSSHSPPDGSRMRGFTEKQVQQSRLRSDLDKIIKFWHPDLAEAPECVNDFFQAIDNLRPGVATEDTTEWSQNLLTKLEAELQGFMRGQSIS